MSTVELALWDKQFDFITSKEKASLMQCGIGYGKTFAGSVFIANCLQEHHNCNYMIVARDMPQFKKAVLPELLKVLDIFGYIEGEHYKLNRAEMTFSFTKEKVTIYCVGAINYDSSFRGPNIAVIWSDETEYYSEDAWKTMLGRLRIKPELLRCTSSPHGFNFVWEFFKDKQILIAPTQENKGLTQDYLDMLKGAYSDKLYRQEVLAERLNVTTGNIYFEFNRDLNVKECSKINGHPVWFGCDFNNNPLTGVIGQVIDNTLYIFDEYYNDSGQAKTETMSQWVFSKYGKTNAVPDSTGKKATTNANFSDLAILRQLHNVMPAPNPFRIDRYNAVNTRLSQSRIVISPKCIHTIKDLERVSYKAGTNQPEVSDSTLTHISDGLGYLVYKTINPFSLSRRGGVSNL